MANSYVFAGLAGETAPGREVNSGLYRMTNDDGDWETLSNGLPEAPAVRSIAVHPRMPEGGLRWHAGRAVPEQRQRRPLGKGQRERPRAARLVADVPSPRPQCHFRRVRIV